MKKSILILSFFAFNFFLSQENDKRLTPFLKDVGIMSKVSKVLDFSYSSTTIKVNDYNPLIITVDANDIKYRPNSNSSEINAEGIMHLQVSNRMAFLKSALKNLQCYQIEPYRYLVVRLDDKNQNEKYILTQAKQYDCEKLYLLNEDKQPIPQSVFSYSIHNGIPLLYSTPSFDALEFLKLEFLNEQ